MMVIKTLMMDVHKIVRRKKAGHVAIHVNLYVGMAFERSSMRHVMMEMTIQTMAATVRP